MKNKMKLDHFDIEVISEIVLQMKQAAAKAEEQSQRVYGESNAAYEFGYLKGMINIYSDALEIVIGK
jgi:hypothetical protein